MLKISIIMPIYNALKDVKICLNSLLENFDFSTGEIILIDDYSFDETKVYLEEFVKNNVDKFTLFRNDENLGFIKTSNRGMKLANGEIIILLNSDTKIPKNFSKYIIDCFDSDKNIGIASPLRSGSGGYSIEMPKHYNLEKMNEHIRRIHKPIYPIVAYCEGLCFCIRRNVIEKLGYLDEVYGLGYHEEIDYSFNAIKHGIKCVLIDNLYIYHKNFASFGSKKRKKQIKKNDKIFNERWIGFREKINEQYEFRNYANIIEKEMFPTRKLIKTLYSKEKIGNRVIHHVCGIRISHKKHYELIT